MSLTSSHSTNRPTDLTRRKYDRVAAIYDAIEAPMERMIGRWRRELWDAAPAGELLEIGVGTGKSIPFYPSHADVTAIDISTRMLARAERRAHELHNHARFECADVQSLPYGHGRFVAAFSTCVFCSVPDPVQGLREALRVLHPGGRLFMLEHVLSRRPVLRWLMRALDFLPYRLWGAHIARDTVANVRAAGFVIEEERNLIGDVVKLIVARKPLVASNSKRVT